MSPIDMAILILVVSIVSVPAIVGISSFILDSKLHKTIKATFLD